MISPAAPEPRFREKIDEVAEKDLRFVQKIFTFAAARDLARNDHFLEINREKISSSSRNASLRSPCRPGRASAFLQKSGLPPFRRGDFSLRVHPRSHRMASTMFDFPEPFGPTIATMPAGNSKTVFSANDLKPFSSSLFKK